MSSTKKIEAKLRDLLAEKELIDRELKQTRKDLIAINRTHQAAIDRLIGQAVRVCHAKGEPSTVENILLHARAIATPRMQAVLASVEETLSPTTRKDLAAAGVTEMGGSIVCEEEQVPEAAGEQADAVDGALPADKQAPEGADPGRNEGGLETVLSSSRPTALPAIGASVAGRLPLSGMLPQRFAVRTDVKPQVQDHPTKIE